MIYGRCPGESLDCRCDAIRCRALDGALILSQLRIPLPFGVAGVLLTLGNYYDSDEGVVLNGAWKLFNGDLPYRDFFSIVAPGSYLWVTLWFTLLGPSYTAARIAGVILLLSSVVAMYEIVRSVSGRREPAFLGAAVWMIGSAAATVIVNHNPLSSYLAVLAVYALLRALRTRSRVFYLLAGFLAGAVILFLQTKGLAVVAAFCVVLVNCAVKRAVSLDHIAVVAAAAAVLPLVAIVFWTPRLLWHALIEWPAANYPAINQVSFLPVLGMLVLFGVAVFFLTRSTGTERFTIELFPLACLQGFLFLSSFSRPDWQHIFWNSFPGIVVGVVVLDQILSGAARKVTVNRNIVFHRAPATFLVVMSLALAVVAVKQEREFKRLTASMLRQRIYAHPFLPGLYLELRSPDPYPYYALFERMHAGEAFEANLRVLRREHPQYVFTDYALVEKFGYARRNPLDEYLAAAYAQKAFFGPIAIWESKCRGEASAFSSTERRDLCERRRGET